MVVKKLGISGFLIIRRNQKFKKITEFKWLDLKEYLNFEY